MSYRPVPSRTGASMAHGWHMNWAFRSSCVPPIIIPRDLIHGLAVIDTREQVSVAVHGDLQRAMTGEGLHRLWGEPCLDPARYREVAEPVPVEALDLRQQLEQRQELTLNQVVMPDVMTLSVPKDQIFGL